MQFDPATGRIYREWTVSRHLVQTRDGASDWWRQRPRPLSTPRGSRGPRSLVDAAIQVIANNIGDVPDEYLALIPVRLRWRIWRLLEVTSVARLLTDPARYVAGWLTVSPSHHSGVCLHAWKIFSKQLLRDGDDDKPFSLYRFRQRICSPGGLLQGYARPLTSLSTDFVAHLVISGGCSFHTNELLCLADIKNLGVLELIHPAPGEHPAFLQASDRLIRGWTEMEDPFPLLRILRIWEAQSITQTSLRWMSKFPRLTLYDVLGSKEDWSTPWAHVADGGWEMHITVPSREDSPWIDVMLFASLEEARGHRLQDQAKALSVDLHDSCRTIKFVADRKAPSLLDYLKNPARANLPELDQIAPATSPEARLSDEAAIDSWAFWLYSLVGQLTHEDDITSRGVQANVQAVLGPLVLPAKPFASLILGQGGTSTRPPYWLFRPRRYTFTRSAVARQQTEAKPRPLRRPRQDELGRVGQGELRKQKRQRLDDVLQSFSK